MQQTVFIFHSKDSFWIEEQINSRIKRLGNEKNIEITRLSTNKNNNTNILEALRSPSFFSDQRAIIVNNYDEGGRKQQLMEWVNSASKDCLLFLIKNEIKFGSKAFEEAVRRLPGVSVVVEFFIPEERIRKRFATFSKKNNLVFSRTAEELLISFFVENPNLWICETNKIATYFLNHTATIEKEHLSQLVCWEWETSEFSLIDKILDSPPKKSIPHLKNYLRSRGDFHRFLILLQNETEKILCFNEMKKAKISDQVAFIKLKIFYEKAKKKLLRRNKQLSLPNLYLYLNGLYETERILKTISFTHTAIGQPNINLRCLFFFYRTLTLLHKQK